MRKMHHPRVQNNNTRRVGSRILPGAVLAGLCLVSAAAAQAVEVAGVQVPERAEVAGRALALNGAGLRSRFFVRVYVGALYLESAGKREAAQVLADGGVKRVSMHVIHDELAREKITDAWLDGFRGNTPEEELGPMMPRVERFNALWPVLRSGDVAHVDFVPGGGVRVSVNGAERGEVEGDDLQRAVLRIWLGEDPADGDLKRGMLGGA